MSLLVSMSARTLSAIPGTFLPVPPHGVRAFSIWFAALFLLLAGVNALLAPHDPGLLSSNPTPYLILPAFLGVRHGPRGGIIAGIIVASLLALVSYWSGQGGAIPGYFHALVGLPLLGATVGWASRLSGERSAQLRMERDLLLEDNRKYVAERELLLLSRQDLQQRLEFRGADDNAVDEQIAKLQEAADSFLPAAILERLAQITHTRKASVYELPLGRGATALTRVSSIGGIECFPEYLRQEDHPIVSESLARSCFLVQKSLLKTPSARRSGYLAAYPICRPGRTPSYILIVEDIPLEKISPSTFDLMKAVCDRTGGGSQGPTGEGLNHRAISQLKFYAAMESAVETHACYAVPSTLVRVPFDFSGETDPLDAFCDLLEILPRQTLLSNYHENGRRALLFLLPANSDPAVRDGLRDLFCDFVAELGMGSSNIPRFVMTRPSHSPQQLWGELLASDQDVASR